MKSNKIKYTNSTSIYVRRRNMPRIKIGVIGCGYWGPNLIRIFYLEN